MERTVTVEFGPSRSKRFARALAFARERADECVEVEPGKYRASFELGSEPGPYNALHALIREVRYWRATVVHEDDEPVSDYHAKEMAFCAASQLQMFGDCHWRFYYGVLPRCSLCPLFDAERAMRDVLGKIRLPEGFLDGSLGPKLRALFQGELPPLPDEQLDVDIEVPDFVPEEWPGPPAEEPPG
jgi:hypothetical protein